MTTRRVLLVDADAFFVAVARLVDPEGAGRAALLIVGGTPEGRGVVCSASYETRAFGVRSAMSTAHALRLCPKALCVPVPRRACVEKSREIRRALERFTPVVQGASIDEWYLDLGGTEALYAHEPLADTARRIRDAVREATGLSVSIGGGTSKLVAKLAVERAKPKPGTGATGVHVVPAGEEAAFMRTVALAEIPGVGPRAQERLAKFGLTTVPDVLQYELPVLERWLGAREAAWLYARARGIDERPVAEREAAKSVSREDTFHTDVADDAVLQRELGRLAARVAADLRGDGVTARTITVKVKDFDSRIRQASRTLPRAVDSDKAVAAVAQALLVKLRAGRRVPARLLGVALSGLGPAAPAEQLALFTAAAEPPVETDRDRAVSRLRDSLRAKFGGGVIS
jgi:DNA polymerase-4